MPTIDEPAGAAGLQHDPKEVLAVAKAIWDTDPRNQAYSDAELRRRVWEQDKPSYLRLAAFFMIQLQRQGYVLARDADEGLA